MLRDLVNKTDDEKLNSVKLKTLLVWKIEEGTTSHRHMTKMMEVMLNSENYIVPVAMAFNKETEKTRDIK